MQRQTPADRIEIVGQRPIVEEAELLFDLPRLLKANLLFLLR